MYIYLKIDNIHFLNFKSRNTLITFWRMYIYGTVYYSFIKIEINILKKKKRRSFSFMSFGSEYF